MARCKSLFDNTLPVSLSDSILCKGQAIPPSSKSLRKRILAGRVKKIVRAYMQRTPTFSIACPQNIEPYRLCSISREPDGRSEAGNTAFAAQKGQPIQRRHLDQRQPPAMLAASIGDPADTSVPCEAANTLLRTLRMPLTGFGTRSAVDGKSAV